ncbi:hypothetical protein [Arthrobacter polaris]|uniref:hypothetical protein n=1 Tax=Arthrobacter polaris TaxID=2813727 RepID=UPI003D7DABDD
MSFLKAVGAASTSDSDGTLRARGPRSRGNLACTAVGNDITARNIAGAVSALRAHPRLA